MGIQSGRLLGMAGLAAVLFVWALAFSGCETTESAARKDASSQAGAGGMSSQDAPSQPLLTEQVMSIPGPKRTVAVGKFDAIGAFTQKYGNWDIGGGMSAMLVTALKESERFIVLERANISQVLSEQQMKGQRLVHEGSGPALGKIIGVNLLIYGSITEFGAEDKGGGFSVGIAGGGLMGGGLSRKSTSGSVTMDIRIVDTTTTEVLDVYKVTEPISSSGWDMNLGYKGVSFGTNQFIKTPLGQACRNAVNKAVRLIAAKANQTPWCAHVVTFDGAEIFINAGSRAGLRIGDRFMVQQIVQRLTDPQTGQLLSVRKAELGVIEITHVEPRLSSGLFMATGQEYPMRGDLVVPCTE